MSNMYQKYIQDSVDNVITNQLANIGDYRGHDCLCYYARSECDVKISEYDLLLSTITSVHVNNHIIFMKLLQKLK
jgi:hypothetical protein